MRIIHVCLAAYYIDDYSYQENVLPRMHIKQGHDVLILASTETLSPNNKLSYVNSSSYLNDDGIKVVRIPYLKGIPKFLVRKLRIYPNVYYNLCKFKPDLIFLHDIQFVSINQVKKYAKKNPKVRIVADGHADFINSAHGFLSKNILHGLIYKQCAQAILPYTEKFYGTLPSRVEFFHEMYHIPRNKLELLLMGADDNLVDEVKADSSRQAIRNKYGFTKKDIVLVTGGKIDQNKIAVLELMDAVKETSENIKLLIFGSVSLELANIFNSKLVDNKIVMYGWASEKETYQILNSADIAVYPCWHSTLWEQSAGLGLPCILHRIQGFQHININNNCIFVEPCSKDNLLKAINICVNDFELFKKNAQEVSINFSYARIAQKAIL
ncbi:hypothetical protein B5E77_03910 [Lachnoclostridium sp. An131]|uniref:glycosyltransferase family 4 protein n=1 Tax=Lachnoclostridium sp. An131 TaxID=1965555 RepID=UPI000B393290|nr:glycosyltransferase family 4 protein [Lachnoclostridium sp. An131]OUQ27971.1 hypothetical protein B5E77_03910 [Lachnoclostridium sp. An131]